MPIFLHIKMLVHIISLSAAFFETYVISYNIYFAEEEVLHVLSQMPCAQLCVHVCDHLSHKEVPLMCISVDLLALQVTQQPAQSTHAHVVGEPCSEHGRHGVGRCSN